MESQEDLLTGVERHRFDRNICFLCACQLDSVNRTEEHVVPRWAQERFDLWNQRLRLLNGTQIPYRQLTVPCCSGCNSTHLTRLEVEIAAATKDGARGVRDLPPKTVFLWLAKIFWGLLYRELFLLADRRLPEDGPITNPEFLRQFRMHHYFLQASRGLVTFVDFLPGSVFVYEVQPTQDPRHHWFLRDDFASLFICCTVGSVGFVAALQDGGAQYAKLRIPFSDVREHALHPLQFREVAAKHLYTAMLFDRLPKYFITEAGEVRQLPLQGLSPKPIFKRWSQEEYAQVLAQVSEQPYGQIFSPPNLVMTWLRGSEGGGLRTISFEECPWPPRAAAEPGVAPLVGSASKKNRD